MPAISSRMEKKSGRKSKMISRRRQRFSTLRIDTLEDRRLLATLIGLTDGDELVRFDSATPGTVSTPIAITGLAVGEDILGIDFRPATGQLYGVGSTNRLYIINPITAVATEVATLSTPLPGGAVSFGVDFNPVVDRLRITTDTGENFRVNVDTGEAIVDGPLAFEVGDPNEGVPPTIGGSAYVNSFPGTVTTALYDIDTDLDVLVQQNPANDGTLITIGSLGVDAEDVLGFDVVSGSPGEALAALNVGGATSLYTIDLGTGAATLVGDVTGVTLDGLAAFPAGETGAGNVFFVDDDFDVGEDTDGDNDFLTIQAAIDAASDGDIIYVAPGLYPEDGQVEINKSVTLIGAQGSRDARPGAGNSGGTLDESFVTARFLIAADGVTIDGFRIQAVFSGAGIQATSDFSGYTIINNFVIGNVIGMALESSGVEPSVVRQNYISGNVLPGSGSGTGVYSDVGLQNITIDNNEFDQHAPFSGLAINLASSGATDHRDITISNNTFNTDSVIISSTTGLEFISNEFEDTPFRALELAGGNTDILIEENTFTFPEVGSIVLNNRADFGSPGANTEVVIRANILNYDAGSIFNDLNVRAAIQVFDEADSIEILENQVTITGDIDPIVAFHGIWIASPGNDLTGSVVVSSNTISGAGNEDPVVDEELNSAGILIGDQLADTATVTVDLNIVSGFIDGIRVNGTAVVDGNQANENGVGLNVSGGTALVQNNNLNDNEIGLLIQNDATVDAGQTTISDDYTGLGVSVGNNNFSSYQPGAIAISNLNTNATPGEDTQFPPDVSARNNIFFASDTALIEQVVNHENDDVALAFVDFADAQQGVNLPPDAVDDSETTEQDTAVTIDVLANDTDPEGDTLTVIDVTQPDPTEGTVVNNNDGTVTFTPASGFVGTATFTYTISDGQGNEDTATVTVTVTAESDNQPPVANDDTAITSNDTAIDIPVLNNDNDPDGDPLTIASVTQPAIGGVVTINPGNQSVRFTPTPGFVGQASFSYTVSDGQGGTDMALVTVTVTDGSSQGPDDDFPSDPDEVPRDGTVEGFVRNLYEDVLDRAPDQAGFDYWVAQLNAGRSRTEVAEAFLHSAEYVFNLVQEFYKEFLGRTATVGFDPVTNTFTGPEAFFFNILYGDGSERDDERREGAGREEDVIAGIMASQEYALIKGATNEAYVQSLYQDLLGRPADGGGLDYFVQQLNAGRSRFDVAKEILNSPELNLLLLDDPTGRVDFMEGWFQDYFEGADEANKPGFDAYFAQLGDDARWRDVQQDILDSDEYFVASGGVV